MLGIEMSIQGAAEFYAYEVFRRLGQGVSHTTVYRALRSRTGSPAHEPLGARKRLRRPKTGHHAVTTG
jgi:hypothetical protein